MCASTNCLFAGELSLFIFLMFAQCPEFSSLQTPVPSKLGISVPLCHSSGHRSVGVPLFMLPDPTALQCPDMKRTAGLGLAAPTPATSATRQRKASRAIIGTFLGDILSQGQRSCRDTACAGGFVQLEMGKLRTEEARSPSSYLVSWAIEKNTKVIRHIEKCTQSW